MEMEIPEVLRVWEEVVGKARTIMQLVGSRWSRTECCNLDRAFGYDRCACCQSAASSFTNPDRIRAGNFLVPCRAFINSSTGEINPALSTPGPIRYTTSLPVAMVVHR